MDGFWRIDTSSRIEQLIAAIDKHNFGDDNLQSMCLREVIRSFERFYLASCKSNDERIHRGIKFLQKKCSAFIADQLNFAGRMKSEYCSIIINKHLKRIDSRWFSNIEDSKVIHEKVKEIGDEIEYFDATHFDGSVCKYLLRFHRNLKHFRHKAGFQEVLEPLSQYCSNLETLTFKQIDKNGMRFLGTKNDGKAAFPKLKLLDISSMCLEQTDVQFILKNLRALESLYCSSCYNISLAIYELHIADFKKHVLCTVEPYNITTLEFGLFSDSELTIALKICATVCPNVKEITALVYSQENVNACLGFSNLEILELQHRCMKEGLSVNGFLKLRGIKLVALNLIDISISPCALIQNCQQLQGLFLSCLDFTPQTCSLLHSSINVKELKLDYLALNDSRNIDSVDHILKSCQSLHSLSFSACEFSNEFEQVLLNFCKKCTLKELEFFITLVNGKIVEEILYACSSLKLLQLRPCPYFSRAVDAISLKSISDALPNKPRIIYHNV